jgi:hypothetical protein
VLTRRRLKHSAFRSVKELVDAIDLWTDVWNIDPQPFMWTKTADEIIAKVRSGRAALNHPTKSATDH